jgi:NAD(P)H-flavin reductase
MRTHSGTTAKLRKRTSLPVLVESSYGLPKPLDAYPLLICVAGGVGITAILPYLHAHKGQAKLFWGSRSQALVNALKEEVRGYGGEIIVGRRLFVKLALQREFEKVNDDVAVAVVVSGPKGMGDDVRELVCEIAKARRGDVRLLDENFGW